jgi:hypothetical protein
VLQVGLKDLEPSVADALFRQVDSDQSGRVSFAEVNRMVRGIISSPIKPVVRQRSERAWALVKHNSSADLRKASVREEVVPDVKDLRKGSRRVNVRGSLVNEDAFAPKPSVPRAVRPPPLVTRNFLMPVELTNLRKDIKMEVVTRVVRAEVQNAMDEELYDLLGQGDWSPPATGVGPLGIARPNSEWLHDHRDQETGHSHSALRRQSTLTKGFAKSPLATLRRKIMVDKRK